MSLPYELISPPIALRTRDPALTVLSDQDTAIVDLSSFQPRLHKRLTRSVKNMHELRLYADMTELGFIMHKVNNECQSG